MKELSIEEKAQRFDEAVNKLKIMHDDWSKTQNRAAKEVEEIFPEFAEPKDERIMKLLIEAVIQVLQDQYCSNRGVSKEKVVAWLEKQAEHANFRNKIQIGDKVTRNEDGVLVNLSQLNRVAKKDDKQGEQKPIDKIQLGKKYKCIASPRYSTFMVGEIYKPEDKFLCSLMNFCSDCFELIEDGEQKPAWSDEDEKQARQIERIVHDDGCTQKLQKQIADWFKSLKERCNWKPSDEQMNALNYVVNLMASSERPTENDLYYNILKSLRQQLKKLKE